MWCKVTFCGSLGNVRPKTKKDKKKKEIIISVLSRSVNFTNGNETTGSGESLGLSKFFFIALVLKVNLAVLSP